MKIVLSGIETNNKGAELMLYAILQEIDKYLMHGYSYIVLHCLFLFQTTLFSYNLNLF